jgi:YegS/Rv2252/BmrU family lipid kinase
LSESAGEPEDVVKMRGTTDPARRLLVIYNPTSGRGRQQHMARVFEALRNEGARVELQETTQAGDAERIAGAVSRQEADVVVVAGGDGTVNEVINGLMSGGQEALPALGLIPIGTTNVLARDLRIPAQAEALARLLAHGPAQTIYVGRSNGRFFSLMCGVGLDARVVDRTSLRLKRKIGKLAYVLQGLRELAAYVPRRYRVRIDDSTTFEASSVVVAKSRFYGGEFQLAPEASLRKSELQVCLFQRDGRWSALLYILGMATRQIARMPGYKTVPASKVLVTEHDGDPAQLDGDSRGRVPLHVDLCERPLRVIAPY